MSAIEAGQDALRTDETLGDEHRRARRRGSIAPPRQEPSGRRPMVMSLGAVLALLIPAVPASAQETVTLEAEDGVVVHADRYDQWGETSRGAILMFHQADGNAGEYYEIAVRLAAQGFDALAIDQRLGGTMFGLPNRTVAGLTGPVMSTDAVLPDLRAALDYARAAWPDAPLLLWGSSYSADLVVALAAEKPQGVAGVLTFSPVGLMRERDLLAVAGDVTVPVFITYATMDDERTLAMALAEAVPARLAVLDEPEVGAHGSMTLMEATNPGGWEAEWEAITAFLARVAPCGRTRAAIALTVSHGCNGSGPAGP